MALRFASKWLHRAFWVALIWSAAYVLWLPEIAWLKKINPTTTAYIQRRIKQAQDKGQKLRPRMIWAPWNNISDNLKNAVLTAEDDGFYRHGGVDWEGVRAAAIRNWDEKRLGYGASTITQQVARNLFLSPSKNPLRKLKELLITYKLERELSKQRILELYLNIAEWGKGIFGCEAAAQAYFEKSCADLSVEEAVAMAVVLPNPRRWQPVGSSRYVARNSRRVLQRMKASGLLQEEGEFTVDWDHVGPQISELPGPPLGASGPSPSANP